MTLLRESHYGVGTDWGFSLYVLAYVPKNELDKLSSIDINSEEASEYIRCMFGPVIELTHNHGTESKLDFKYVLYIYI